MSDLTIERHFDANAETVFAFVTEAEKLLQWWGPEGVTISDSELSFTEPGPWKSTMVNAKGGKHKVSGQVLTVDPPRSVEFTWGWHDENGQRGHESHVRFDVKPNASGGATLMLTHTGLPDDESSANHNEGWTSSLVKLERVVT